MEDADPLKFYRAIADHARRSLNSGAHLWFEGHYLHSAEVAEMLKTNSFREVQLYKDLSGQDRFIFAKV